MEGLGECLEPPRWTLREKKQATSDSNISGLGIVVDALESSSSSSSKMLMHRQKGPSVVSVCSGCRGNILEREQAGVQSCTYTQNQQLML